MPQLFPFNFIGISVQTNNTSGQASQDLGNLWNRFFTDQISDKITNKISEDIYCIYTDYSGDYTQGYSAFLGYKVDNLDDVPDGLLGREFKGGEYIKFLAKGDMPKAVVESWEEIWSKDKELNRKYTADFEVYGSKSQAGSDSEVEIFIAI